MGALCTVRDMDEGARYPQVPLKRGHYESFYVKAASPGGGRALWIRHTVHKRPGHEPTASVWFTYFDRASSGPRATKLTVGAEQLSTPAGEWIRVASASIGPGQASGSVATDALDATWELEFDASGEPCHYLPWGFLYRAPLPRTKFSAPVPSTRFKGTLDLNGERLEIDGWPGMVGHNWGSEHAERWVWLEGTGFDEDPDAYFDTGAARIKVGGRVLPWIAAGMLRLDGVEHRLGGPGRIRSTAVDAVPGRCEFVLPGRGITVRGTLDAPSEDFVGWVYADPDGPEHHTINCSVCDLELRVESDDGPSRTLRLSRGGAFELGMRETDHGIPIQPYPDG